MKKLAVSLLFGSIGVIFAQDSIGIKNHNEPEAKEINASEFILNEYKFQFDKYSEEQKLKLFTGDITEEWYQYQKYLKYVRRLKNIPETNKPSYSHSPRYLHQTGQLILESSSSSGYGTKIYQNGNTYSIITTKYGSINEVTKVIIN